jgi:hypothetical protein
MVIRGHRRRSVQPHGPGPFRNLYRYHPGSATYVRAARRWCRTPPDRDGANAALTGNFTGDGDGESRWSTTSATPTTRAYPKVVAIISYDESTETIKQYAPYALTVNGKLQPGGGTE